MNAGGTLYRLAPVLAGLLAVLVWEGLVRAVHVPAYILPAPSAIARAMIEDWEGLIAAAAVTLTIALKAFVVALVLALSAAIGFSRSAVLNAIFYPYAVILQVTPVVSIAPLIIIWVGIDNVGLALTILATIVAFFPILSNAILGFSSVDPNLRDLMRLYGASSWQVFWRLEMPSAAPQILTGMKIAGGLALIGAVVAEFVAGSGGSTGLAWKIIEAGNRLQIPAMFAALVLLSALGITIFATLSALETYLLGAWHESQR